MKPECRFCGALLETTLVDLGEAPLSNAYLEPHQLNDEEPLFPLHARVCGSCFLVQIEQVESPDVIFSDYAYFSSYSESWLDHARRFAAEVTDHLSLTTDSLVVEVASNDGYLLQYFAALGVPVLGIEPAANVAEVARTRGVPTETRFFDAGLASDLAADGIAADLIVGNNVLAHVPDLNGFVGGFSKLLKPRGVVSIEVPHLLRLLEGVQFDTIYHEHFSYFSLYTVERVFAAHGLKIFDVEELPTHGGSLRLWASLADRGLEETYRLAKVRSDERAARVDDLKTYMDFAQKVESCRSSLQRFFQEARLRGLEVVAYGAAAKGNTLLNHCGATSDDIRYVVDRSPHKQGRYLPGTHLQIAPPERVVETRPDYLLILPWNLRGEIMEQMSHIRSWGGRFVTPIPTVEVHE